MPLTKPKWPIFVRRRAHLLTNSSYNRAIDTQRIDAPPDHALRVFSAVNQSISPDPTSETYCYAR